VRVWGGRINGNIAVFDTAHNECKIAVIFCCRARIHVYIYVYIYIHIYICCILVTYFIHVFLVAILLHIFIYMYTYVYTNIYVHIYVYIYIYIYQYVLSQYSLNCLSISFALYTFILNTTIYTILNTTIIQLYHIKYNFILNTTISCPISDFWVGDVQSRKKRVN